MAFSNPTITAQTVDAQASARVRKTTAQRRTTRAHVNDTTRTFPRTLEEAFPENFYDLERYERWEWEEKHDPTIAEKWLNITYAFAAGFIVAMLIFGH